VKEKDRRIEELEKELKALPPLNYQPIDFKEF